MRGTMLQISPLGELTAVFRCECGVRLTCVPSWEKPLNRVATCESCGRVYWLKANVEECPTVICKGCGVRFLPERINAARCPACVLTGAGS